MQKREITCALKKQIITSPFILGTESPTLKGCNGSQPCPSPALGQSSGSDSIAGVWLRGLPCQSLHTSPWMVSRLRYRLLHLLSFCLACRGWWGSVSHASKEWIYVQNLICVPSVSRETDCQYLIPSLQNAVHLETFPEKTGETITTFWWSFLLLKESSIISFQA